MTPPRQGGAPVAGDLDHQVQWSKGSATIRICLIPHALVRGERVWARGGTSGDETPPPASPATDGPPPPPASLVRCLQQLFSKHFVSDILVFLRFHAFLLDFFEIQRCFVDRRTKFYSNAVFLWKGGSFHCKILFF